MCRGSHWAILPLGHSYCFPVSGEAQGSKVTCPRSEGKEIGFLDPSPGTLHLDTLLFLLFAVPGTEHSVCRVPGKPLRLNCAQPTDSSLLLFCLSLGLPSGILPVENYSPAPIWTPAVSWCPRTSSSWSFPVVLSFLASSQSVHWKSLYPSNGSLIIAYIFVGRVVPVKSDRRLGTFVFSFTCTTFFSRLHC